jgi:arylsulfatase A-like enzyme
VTVASFLKSHGYHTACVGKWHLGMDWVKREGKNITELGIETPGQVNNVDYAQPTKNGPNSVGFDWYFGISASLDMVPYTFLENDRCTILPTEERSFAMMLGREGQSTRKGPAAPGFEAEQVLPTLTKKAVEYIGERAGILAKRPEPFFLYVPLASPHTPIAATKEWQEKSGLNPYADFVMQTDAAIGEIVGAIDRYHLANQTLVIVTSDNGCSPMARFDELAAKGHRPSHAFRGHKADIYEGGHRVPFLVRWPGRVAPGKRSDETVWLGDLLATCADLVDRKLPANAGEDSVSLLPAILGRKNAVAHDAVVHHSVNGSFAIRQQNWKLIFAPGSGGWSEPRPGKDDTSAQPLVQLYDLASDIGETRNVQAEHPDVVARLTALMEKYVENGRSTPGDKQPNTAPVDIWKAGKEAHQPLKRP